MARAAASLVLAAAAILAGFAVGPVGAEEMTGACLHFPPGKIEGQPIRPGFEIEILNAALGVGGDTVRLDFYPWARALALAESGEVDLLCGCSDDPSRRETLMTSDPVGKLSIGLFGLAEQGETQLPGLDDLSGVSVGVIAGYNLVTDLRQAGAMPVRVDNDVEGLRMLAGRRFALFYGFADSVRYTLHDKRMTLALSFRELRAEANHVCFSRKAGDAAARAARFNRGLSAIRADGRIDAIRERYGLAD
jgi:ABC-type amino acid transport substrate-binding protein